MPANCDKDGILKRVAGVPAARRGEGIVQRALLMDSFSAAVAAADPANRIASCLPEPPAGRTLVVGAGKAAASMAQAVEAAWPRDSSLDGLVITRYGHGAPTRSIRVVEAGHPVPDGAGERAAEEMLGLVQGLGPDDLLLALISGGGSSLLALPAEGIGMPDLKAATRALLRCGAPITEINVVRKHLTRTQGGQLAALCAAPVVSLIISDVPGDDPAAIASGPTVADPSTYQEALAVLARWQVDVPLSVREHLEHGALGARPETPKPGDPRLAGAGHRLVATAQQSLEAAYAFFRARGITPAVLGDSVTGEAREVARVYAALVRQIVAHGHPFRPPVALISGGECSVTVRGKGRGGRCAEFLLALFCELRDVPNLAALACDTDGIDGSESNAGAFFTPEIAAKARSLGLKPRAFLDQNDAYGFFERVGGLVTTGPTRTNVNDYRVILVE
jgi:glycerate 2-kinase